MFLRNCSICPRDFRPAKNETRERVDLEEGVEVGLVVGTEEDTLRRTMTSSAVSCEDRILQLSIDVYCFSIKHTRQIA